MFEIFGKKNRERKTLEEFVRTNWEELPYEESIKNLKSGLVEIICENKHYSNGILITENGYFLTALHCLEKIPEKLKIKTEDNQVYPRIKICCKNPREDLVLAKIDINKKFLPKKYSFYNTEKFERIPILSLTRKNGKIVEKYGLTQTNWNPAKNKNGNYYANFLSINGISEPGDSGGIIISPRGKLMGINSESDGKIHGGVIKIRSALDLIYNYLKE